MQVIQIYGVSNLFSDRVSSHLRYPILLSGFLEVKRGYAHDPVFIQNTQVTAIDGPNLPDENISLALYGTLENEFGSRGFKAKLRADDELVLSLLIPNISPENLLPLNQLPTLNVVRPDKSSIELPPEI